jgi:hypothetical protein
VKKSRRIEKKVAPAYSALTIHLISARLELNEVLEELNQIRDPYIKCLLLLDIAATLSEKPYRGASWSFDLANEILSYVISLLEENPIDDGFEKSNLWYLIYKVQSGFKLNGLENSRSKLLEAIDQIKDKAVNNQPGKDWNKFHDFFGEKIDLILKLASLTKEQEIFDLAINTAMKFDLDHQSGSYCSRYLARIASLDLNQTPLILDRIQKSESIKEKDKNGVVIDFLNKIDF